MSEVTPEDLVGAYTLDEFVITYLDERPPTYPFGRDPRGQIMYSAGGKMSATLSQADREPHAVARLESYASASDASKVAAFDSYLSYCGSWTLQGDTVTHHVELAMVPDIVGVSQKRHVAIDGDILTLSYEVEARSGVTRFYTLTWTRVSR